MSDEPGQRIAYTALAEGTRVFDCEGAEVGSVSKVLAVAAEDVFEGVVITVERGQARFIEAEQVGDIYEHRLELKIDSSEVIGRPEHDSGSGA
jgi:hypothetical protein